MHRRLDDAIAAAGGRGAGREILKPHAGLAAAAQNIGLAMRFEHAGVSGGKRACDGDAHAVLAIGHGGVGALPFDQNRHHDQTGAAKLKAVAHIPG